MTELFSYYCFKLTDNSDEVYSIYTVSYCTRTGAAMPLSLSQTLTDPVPR